jgi:hypothetical protein
MNKILKIRTASSSFIKFKNLPACINCVHFIEDKTNYPYDPPPNDEKYGKCKLFGKQDMVTGTINYEFASLCRENEKKCGEKGQYFDSNK